MPYICPLCQTPLQFDATQKSYQCANNHHFDQAKEGYVNLLPAQHKKSKQPGDSKEMMRARRNFLEADFYQPLALAITKIIEEHLPQDQANVLDMGCGEGYYSRQIQAHTSNSNQLELHGIDIAKNAIIAAAKKQPDAHFIVASSERMPYSDEYFNMLFRVYAPSNDLEINRVLKTNGLLLTVTPGPRHLWQLKEFIYQDAKEHEALPPLPKGFESLSSQHLSYKIQPNQEQRLALLQMTPFAWRADEATQKAIQQAHNLEIETDFILSLSIKK